MSIRTITFAGLALVALTSGAFAGAHGVHHNTDTHVLGLPPTPLQRALNNPGSQILRVPCALCSYKPPLLTIRK
jgi:hypothetical protein